MTLNCFRPILQLQRRGLNHSLHSTSMNRKSHKHCEPPMQTVVALALGICLAGFVMSWLALGRLTDANRAQWAAYRASVQAKKYAEQADLCYTKIRDVENSIVHLIRELKNRDRK